MVIAIVLRLLGLVQPFIFQAIIDRVLPFQREATLVLIVVVLIVTALFSAGLDALSAYLGNHMANRLTAELARRIFDHVLNLPLRILQRWQVGETLARVDEIDTVRSFLTGTVTGIVLDVLFALVYIGALLSISPFLTVVVLIVLPLQILAFSVVGPFIRRRMQDSFFAGSRHQARLVEAFGNIVAIKALASERLQVQRFQETLNTSLFASFRVAKLNILSGFIGDLLGNGATILTIFFGSRLVFQQEITLGELIAFNMLAEKVAGPIMSLSTLWEQWQGLKIALLRLGDFLNEGAESETERPDLRVDGSLRLHLERVSFGYDADHPIIRDMSITIDADRPTVIVGASGCGKSTLAKLICGLYVPDGGAISANGADLGGYSPGSVRHTISYLPQEPALFAGSILDNLRMAKPDATDAEIDEALAASACQSFVSKLPGGIDFDVGDVGSRLSGGQRQRIALARALLTNPAALVLDEPTSALDPKSAAKIVETLRALVRRKTVVIITHNRTLLGEEPVTLIDLDHPDDFRVST